MSKLKTTILTGFLGAGKTTLLNRILTLGSTERVAVIVNEYGEVGIDGQLVVQTKDEIVELNDGCICCTVRDDLIAAIRSLLASGRPIDHFIIETSGLADPAPVIQSFILDEVLSARLELDAIVTVVDARHISRQLSQEEAVEQISFADVLLLNKIDLEDEYRLIEIERDLTRRNPLARIIRTSSCDVELADVLGIGAFDLKNILAIDPNILDEHAHEHDQTIGCVAIRDYGALDPVALNGWLTRLVQEIGTDLFRMKGVLNFAGEARRYVFHGVHMTLEGRPGKMWQPFEARVSDMVFIGRNLDEGGLREGFRSCLAKPHALAS
ncbi:MULTISPECIES: CobW family GTP-binding protein [Rhizobium]|uniref:GTP-binding protein n=1 Tax=Rhizobium leguminosarum bv. viciae TaxID=387 RepID=A0A8G2IT81_RHILV|nr:MULTISPECIES: GTP-binding protein [Rhizobium]MBC2806951.1 GTP-binding protein [Rhizobium ruizarguesonis]MBY5516846.1 GTP-binding protein [Rhizobium leguminosarum]NKK11234.1 GTP-binding protein [Rhizobium leguminosarum bv. viciae]NKK25059.1 GTP-binding protein [Rhizobium leguminosarum bv. viciae]NKQ87356.1 cobalamin biosynthesis protein CobW [Rhizobium ruizarguesonis]